MFELERRHIGHLQLVPSTPPSQHVVRLLICARALSLLLLSSRKIPKPPKPESYALWKHPERSRDSIPSSLLLTAAEMAAAATTIKITAVQLLGPGRQATRVPQEDEACSPIAVSAEPRADARQARRVTEIRPTPQGVCLPGQQQEHQELVRVREPVWGPGFVVQQR